MDLFALLSLTLAVAAVLAWCNERWLHLPTTIGVMALALGVSLVAVLLAPEAWRTWAEGLLQRLDLGHALLDVLLAFLLFAGALHVKFDRLYRQRWIVGGLATVGVVASTGLVGVMTWAVSRALGAPLGWGPSLIFGALISPTDPIAVLGILKRAGAPRSLETKIVGESLFNDGVGVVVFLVIVGIVTGQDGHGLDAGGVARLFLQEVGGSLVLGAGVGWVVFLMLRTIDRYEVEVLLTLSLCAGLYSLALALHMSGPIAVVVAGLMIGNTGRRLAMSPSTVERLDHFWELVDEILNVVLFTLMGLEVLVLRATGTSLVLGLCAIPCVLLARFVAVGGMVRLLSQWRHFTPHAVKVMTWAGLRGGISVALALSLAPALEGRDVLISMTYVVVVFSILVQGLTVGRLIARIPRAEELDQPAH